jgi:hypothetical protein
LTAGTILLDNVKATSGQGCNYGPLRVDAMSGVDLTISGDSSSFVSGSAFPAIDFAASNGTVAITGVQIQPDAYFLAMSGNSNTLSVDSAKIGPIVISGNSNHVSYKTVTQLESGCGTVVRVSGEANTLTLTGSTITGCGPVVYINVNGTPNTLNLSGTTVKSSSTTNEVINFNVGQLSLLAGTVVQGGTRGVLLGGAASLRMRGTTIKGYGSFGLLLEGFPTSVDLGTDIEAGMNTFTGPAGAGQFAIEDLSGNPPPPITCSQTTFNGVAPSAGIVTGYVAVAGVYELPMGHSIHFY